MKWGVGLGKWVDGLSDDAAKFAGNAYQSLCLLRE